MARTATQYAVRQHVGPLAVLVQEGFQTLNQAKMAILDLQEKDPGDYWVRKIETTDYSAEDLGMIDDQS
jgi:hypothetical protein